MKVRLLKPEVMKLKLVAVLCLLLPFAFWIWLGYSDTGRVGFKKDHWLLQLPNFPLFCLFGPFHWLWKVILG